MLWCGVVWNDAPESRTHESTRPSTYEIETLVVFAAASRASYFLGESIDATNASAISRVTALVPPALLSSFFGGAW
ncbi:hypothetical protein Bca101_020435 [Brassica carinata]